MVVLAHVLTVLSYERRSCCDVGQSYLAERRVGRVRGRYALFVVRCWYWARRSASLCFRLIRQVFSKYIYILAPARLKKRGLGMNRSRRGRAAAVSYSELPRKRNRTLSTEEKVAMQAGRAAQRALVKRRREQENNGPMEMHKARWQGQSSLMVKHFSAICKRKTWKTSGDTPVCGDGSSVANAAPFACFLSRLCSPEWGCVGSIVDLGCGDLTYMRTVDLGGVQYQGYDCVRAHVLKVGEANMHIGKANVADPKFLRNLGAFDIVLLKDVLQHWEDAHIRPALDVLAEGVASGKHKLLVVVSSSFFLLVDVGLCR